MRTLEITAINENLQKRTSGSTRLSSIPAQFFYILLLLLSLSTGQAPAEEAVSLYNGKPASYWLNLARAGSHDEKLAAAPVLAQILKDEHIKRENGQTAAADALARESMGEPAKGAEPALTAMLQD